MRVDQSGSPDRNRMSIILRHAHVRLCGLGVDRFVGNVVYRYGLLVGFFYCRDCLYGGG